MIPNILVGNEVAKIVGRWGGLSPDTV